MHLPRPRHDPVMLGLLVMLALTVAIAFAQYYSTRSVNQQSYDRCIDRQANTTKVNTFARDMARLEADNRFIDQALRDRRIAAYKALVLAPPKCGNP